MSYLHCPTCACAYNVAREPACPRCGIRAGTPADPTDDIISAVEQLARAMARATPIEMIAAQAVLDRRDTQLALPAPGKPIGPSPQLLRAVRAALEPAPEAAPWRGDDRMFASWQGVERMFDRFSPERRQRWRTAIDAALARLSPRLPARAGIATRIDRVKSRVRSLAQRLLAA